MGTTQTSWRSARLLEETRRRRARSTSLPCLVDRAEQSLPSTPRRSCLSTHTHTSSHPRFSFSFTFVSKTRGLHFFLYFDFLSNTRIGLCYNRVGRHGYRLLEG